MSKAQLTARISVLALVAGATFLGGCSTAGPTHSKVVHDLTPEMMGLDKSPYEMQNMTSVTWNAGNRMFWDDVSRAWYTDRPSRLTNIPTTR
jgi:hypothetical protein